MKIDTQAPETPATKFLHKHRIVLKDLKEMNRAHSASASSENAIVVAAEQGGAA